MLFLFSFFLLLFAILFFAAFCSTVCFVIAIGNASLINSWRNRMHNFRVQSCRSDARTQRCTPHTAAAAAFADATDMGRRPSATAVQQQRSPYAQFECIACDEVPKIRCTSNAAAAFPTTTKNTTHAKPVRFDRLHVWIVRAYRTRARTHAYLAVRAESRCLFIL